jgi:hypothetical protein
MEEGYVNDTSSDNNAVELFQAFMWICPDCGAENFVRAVAIDMIDDDEDVLNGEFGVQPWEDGEFVIAPDLVKCCDCSNEYNTAECDEDPGANDWKTDGWETDD